MATLTEATKLFTAQIGVKELPAGSNKTDYGVRYGMNGVPWCMIFIQVLCGQLGVELPVRTASCTAFMYRAKQTANWIKPADIKAGDIVLFNFDKNSDADHVGFCIGATSTAVTCIEGNTSVNGSQDNGGAVCKKTRKKTLVLGAYRPTYDKEKGEIDLTIPTLNKGDKSSTVKAMQLLLIGAGYKCGSSGADGSLGPATVTALTKYQKAKGIKTESNMCGSKTWAALLGV